MNLEKIITDIRRVLEKYLKGIPVFNASEFARMGGKTKSPRKAAAARVNGKLGGRPKTRRKK